MNQRCIQRWRRLILPYCVNRIGIHCHQLSADLGKRFAHHISPVARMEPCIIANPRAFLGIVSQPAGDRVGWNRAIFVKLLVHLLAHLNGVAPVDKNRSFLDQNGCAARGSAKPCQPFEPLRIRADIFAHMLICYRHEKSVQLLPLQFLP